MANPLLKRLLGEAAEDPVEHHLKNVGAGVPPAGRSYPEMPTDVSKMSNVEFDAHQYRQQKAAGEEANMGNPEEKREVQIGRAIKGIIAGGYASGLGQSWSYELDEISDLADELISMHGQSPA